MAASFGLGEANAKLTCETAIKSDLTRCLRHPRHRGRCQARQCREFRSGNRWASSLPRASPPRPKLRKLLNPGKAAVPAVDEVVFHAFKKEGRRQKGRLQGHQGCDLHGHRETTRRSSYCSMRLRADRSPVSKRSRPRWSSPR